MSLQTRFTRVIKAIGPMAMSIACLLSALSSLGSGQEPSQSKTNSLYRIGPGDVLKVLVLKQAMLSQDDVRVSNEGTIRLPMLDQPIRAACQTEMELAAEITERYKKYILDPQVYVSVKDFKANPVSIVGAVNSPGSFQMERPTRLLEILALAKGPTTGAGNEVQIIRTASAAGCGAPEAGGQANSGDEVITLALSDVMKGTDEQNPILQAGDIVRVNEALTKQAFVIGNVKAAMIVNLKEPVTLSRAVAMAGGPAPGAQVDKIKLSRQAPGSFTKTELIVSLKELNKGTKEDIVLQPNDVVDVPGPSATRKLITGIFSSAIPAITRVPVGIPIP